MCELISYCPKIAPHAAICHLRFARLRRWSCQCHRAACRKLVTAQNQLTIHSYRTTRGVELLPSGHALRTSASAHNVAHVATPTDRHRTVSSPSPGPHHPPHSTLVAPAIDIPELPPNDTGIVDISQGTVSSVASSSQSAWLHTHVSASTFTEMPTCMDPQASSTLGQPTAGSEPVSVCQADKAHSLARPGSSQASNLRIHYDFRPLPDYSESQCENAQLEWLSYILRQTEEEARNSRETLLVAHERKRFIAARLRLLEQFCPEDILDPITYLVVEDDSKSIPAQDVNSPQ